MAAPARFIDPRVLARIGNLELVARTVVDGFISGVHRSALPGLSIDFAEHRAYMPGDDVRRIDWRVYARTDRLYVKEYEADTNANALVLLDVSRSMDFGEPITKLDYARFLAASLSYLSSRQRDRVGLVTFDDRILELIPPSARHLETILHTLDRLRPGGTSEYVRVLRRVGQSQPRRSVMILISDLYEEPDRLAGALAELTSSGHELIVFQVLDPAERELPFEVLTNLEDLETGARVPVMPSELQDRYRILMQTHTETLERQLRGRTLEYSLSDTSAPLDHALFRYLSERARLRRVR